MRADNHGEGGILALMSHGRASATGGDARLLGASMGLLGAALIYGDGIITPSISVLSALEGVNVATTTLKPFVLPLAMVDPARPVRGSARLGRRRSAGPSGR